MVGSQSFTRSAWGWTVAVGVGLAMASACGGSVTEQGTQNPGIAPGVTMDDGAADAPSGDDSSIGIGPFLGTPNPPPMGADATTYYGSVEAGVEAGSESAFDAQAAPAGLAGFALVVNGAVQTPRACPAESWEYPPPPEFALVDGGGFNGATDCSINGPPCPGIRTFLVNTGQYPVAYTAQPQWAGGTVGEPPGVDFGNSGELSGVLDVGQKVEITSAFVGGIVAVLGSARPFADPDAGKYVSDGAVIPWPTGVAGSQGSTQMYVAEIEIVASCQTPTGVW